MISNIKKTKKEFTVVDKLDNSKITITNKSEDKLVIYDDEILQNLIFNKFNKKYKELAYLVLDIEESDDSTDSDVELALIKIEDYKELLIKKYFGYLSDIEKEKYLKILAILENRLMNLNFNRGRGR